MNVCELASKNNKQVIDMVIIGQIPNNVIIHIKISKYLQYKISFTSLG
jgi:hypothetical protein